MTTPFLKMHGCGNDFVVLDGRARPLALSPARAAAIADRHTGIGCDQVIVLEPPRNGADVFMRIRNPDGAEAGACGNATRCVATLVANGRSTVAVETVAGRLEARMLGDGTVEVDMGSPRLDWQEIPLARAMDTLHLDLPGDPVGCSMGNPHATFFMDDLAEVDVAGLGARFEVDPLFPEQANIGFAEILAPDWIRLRVWERGAGLTRACGSGACATLVNAVRRGLCDRRVQMVMDGGILDIAWRADGHVMMTGPVATAFRGEIDLDAFAP